MKITHHGGNCCGIKHLVGLSEEPDDYIEEKEETTKEGVSYDRGGQSVTSSFNFHWPERPEETYEERFIAYLEFLARVRPFGLVECSIVVPHDEDAPLLKLYAWAMAEIELGLATYEEQMTDGENIGTGGGLDQSAWIPVFEANGFTCVNEFPNVNSGNTVQIWHLVMKNDWKPNNKKENV